MYHMYIPRLRFGKERDRRLVGNSLRTFESYLTDLPVKYMGGAAT